MHILLSVCVYVWNPLRAASATLPVIACASPSITGLFFSRFLYSLLSQTCSLLSREKKKLFSKSLWQVFSFLFLVNWTNAYITNFLERDFDGGFGGGGRNIVSAKQGKNQPNKQKIQSRRIATSCQRVWHRQNTEVPLWENEKNIAVTQNTASSANFTLIFSYATSTKLEFFRNLCFPEAAALTFWETHSLLLAG